MKIASVSVAGKLSKTICQNDHIFLHGNNLLVFSRSCCRV